LDDLKAENEELKGELTPLMEDIALLSENIVLNHRYSTERNRTARYQGTVTFSWSDLWTIIGPKLFVPVHASRINDLIVARLNHRTTDQHVRDIFDGDLNKIKIQFISYRFIVSYQANAVGGGVNEYIVITEAGKLALAELMTVRRQANTEERG
jgi:hypothetical protein